MRPLSVETPQVVGDFEDRFNSMVVGQPSAGERFARLFGQLKANVSNPNRPKRVLLLVGPTGVGKTLSGRVFNRLTKGNDAQIEVHCDGFVHEGYAAMIIGSPVGYATRSAVGAGRAALSRSFRRTTLTGMSAGASRQRYSSMKSRRVVREC
jgi:ATP-dependent Clp protease ATP-binding subunit ClpA